MATTEYRLNGVPVWIHDEDYAKGDAALMPSPTHDLDTFGLGTSYAHLFPDGVIKRFSRIIGTRDDLIPADRIVEGERSPKALEPK